MRPIRDDITNTSECMEMNVCTHKLAPKNPYTFTASSDIVCPSQSPTAECSRDSEQNKNRALKTTFLETWRKIELSLLRDGPPTLYTATA